MIYMIKVPVLLLLLANTNIVSSFDNNTWPQIQHLCNWESIYFNKNIVANEMEILKTLEVSLSLMKRTINILTRLFNELKSSVTDPISKSAYLEVASNTFDLSRRISNLWPTTLSLMNISFGKLIRNLQLVSFVSFAPEEFLFEPGILEYVKNEYFYYPVNTNFVWSSALTGLVRLQETYNLRTTDLVSGLAPGRTSFFNSTALSASDCIDIGVYCIKAGIPVRAVEWVLEAKLRASNDPGVSPRRINEYLQIAFCYTGDQKRNSQMLRNLLEDPLFIPSNELYKQYGDMISYGCKQLQFFYVDMPFSKVRKDEQGDLFERRLCQKNSHGLIPKDKNLRCRMIHYNQSYLRIGPLKMEEMNIDPPVLIFHQVAYDSEIQELIGNSHNKTRPAVYDYVGKNGSKYKDTQNVHWVSKEYNDLTAKWNRKSTTITNVGLVYSQLPMVASYGLAAEIWLHFDIGPDEFILDSGSQADYMTLMYWLNQPDEGGFTIFPHLNLSVVPLKGSAMMWFNRHADWERDIRILHSGCPVLAGTKWIMTKWFHVLGQNFPKCFSGKEDTRKYYYLESNIIE